MNLLLLLLVAFPGTRIASLPTGELPEPGVWQVNISHRFVPAVFASGWTDDVLQLFNGADVRDVIDKSLGARVLVGASLTVSTREAGVHAAWAPTGWLTVYPEVTAGLRQPAIERTWANVGLCLHHALADRLALAAQPRYTTNGSRHYVSLGLGAKGEVIERWSLGAEVEPVLLGRDSLTTLPSWTVAIDRELGWHNFVLTIGSGLRQSAPGSFLSRRTGSGYDDILDVARGHFRIGFNILRRI
jgi:hypothetical protein